MTKKKTHNKRLGVILAITILSLIAIAVPFISSLAFLSSYINIDTDILSVKDLFKGSIGLKTLTENYDIWVLAVYIIFLVLILVKSILAFASHGKRKYATISMLTLLLSIAFIAATYNFSPSAIWADLKNTMTFIKALDYGIYAMVGSPLVIFILNFFAYKKIKTF